MPSETRARTVVHGIAELWDGHRRIRDAAVVFDGARVVWVGAGVDRPGGLAEVDAHGAIGLPGLVDCHTHTVFAGTRAGDFTRRLAGESYSAILEAGGGIHASVRGTNAASEEELRETTRLRLDRMLAGGTTTAEVKSGYGLTAEGEARMLRVAVGTGSAVEVVPTLLVHVPRPGIDRDALLHEILGEWIPLCAPLARAIDVYCDRGAFTQDESVAILKAGAAAGLALHVHAEQVEWTGIAAESARLGALSADHLERIDAAGITAMAAAGTVAVLLPAAMVYLRDTPPPVAALRAAGVPLAVATDFNPGSSPVSDLLSCATLACLTMGLTVDEALAGITKNAARALGRRYLGWLGPGSAADLALFPPPPGEPACVDVLVQYLGGHCASAVWKRGVRVV